MKHFLLVFAIACMSALPVMAGAIPTDGLTQPTPAVPNQTPSAMALGDIPSVGTVWETALPGLLTTLGLASF